MYKYSPSTNSFYPDSLLEDYKKSGTLPLDLNSVSQDIFSEYTGEPPQGKRREPNSDGFPSWVDVPPPPNDVLLSLEISKLGVIYKQDITDLNTAYLAAIVSDGPAEVTKQQVVRDQITQRKAQYVADIAAAKEKYPI
ncbi:tail assembly chaperone [Citrobacter freundii]|nr:tail assembly chaperone [Citrobacter freundii]